MLAYLKKMFFQESDVPAPTMRPMRTAPALAAAVAAPIPGVVPASIRPRRSPIATVPESEALRPPADIIPTMSLSLASICALLPAELRATASGPIPAHSRIEVPLEKVTDQLPRGAVRIPFGSLRIGAPAGLFPRNEELDEQMIDLPLLDILAQVKPSRRMHQKRIVISGDIPAVFGLAGSTPADVSEPAAEAVKIAAPVVERSVQAVLEPDEPTIPATPALKFVLKEELAPIPEPAGQEAQPLALEIPPEPEEIEIGTPAPVLLPRLSPQAAVDAAMSVDGVAGALCATSDGLLIAGQMPAGVSLRTMAALLPGVLTRIGQYTATVQLGVLDAVTLTIDGARLEARRVAGISFAVLGNPGALVDAESVTHIAGRMGPASA